MHEWLSGGVSPCQGEGRGFESRLVLRKKKRTVSFDTVLFFFGAQPRSEVRISPLPLRSAQNRGLLDLVRRLVLLIKKAETVKTAVSAFFLCV